MQKNADWIPVGALGDAFAPDNHSLPAVTDLAGKTLLLHCENGWLVEYRFASAEQLIWVQHAGDDGKHKGSEHYRATQLRPGVYFVDFVKSGVHASSVSVVLDFNRQVFVGVIGQLPDATESRLPLLQRIEHGKELTAVKALFVRGAIDRPLDTFSQLPEVTAELLGRRVAYVYSAQEKYEHIYLNAAFYTWRCIAGSEKGLADTDACHYYKLADELYFFIWREKIVPTLGVVVLDLKAKKTTGKIMGYEANQVGAVRNFSVGAYAEILSVIPAE